MAKLLTNHDALHIHALCGLITLIYYMYIVFQGTLDYTLHVPILFVNALLSISALQFKIPMNRIKTDRPTIWVLYRFHAIFFSLRPIISTYIGIMYPQAKHLRYALVFITMILGDIATYLYGTDDQTIRAMPFPKSATEKLKRKIARFHASSQFGATISTIMNPQITYLTSFPVYEAAFTMTLVRKGKITSKTWHVLYGLALFVIAIFSTVHAILNNEWGMYMIGMLNAPRLRIKYRLNKYVVWGITLILIHLFAEQLSSIVYLKYFITLYLVYFNALSAKLIYDIISLN